MSEKPSHRPRERRSSWSQLQVVRKPNKSRRDSPCGRKGAVYPRGKGETGRPHGGGIEGSIIRFFGIGVESQSSKKDTPPEKDGKEKGKNGRHQNCPRKNTTPSEVLAPPVPKTAASTTDTSKPEAQETSAPKIKATKTAEAPKTDAPMTDVAKTEAAETETPATETPTTEAPKTDAPKTGAAKTKTGKTVAPTGEAPKAPVPHTDVPSPPATESPVAKPTADGATSTSGDAAAANSGTDDGRAATPASTEKKAPKAPARPGLEKKGTQPQEKTGSATPPAGPAPACACGCACAKPEEKGEAKAGTRAAAPGGGTLAEQDTAFEFAYTPEPGPAGRVDSSWLGTWRDRLMGY